jgi:PadR family transcriptional regulator, regulatory protein PadR
MPKSNADVLQGTLDLLILKTLTRGAQHGYGIAVHIQQVSNEALRVEEGSLYPALHRIEQDGWIKSEWGISENNRRAKFYEITAAGKRQLAAEEKRWAALTAGVASVLEFA